MVDLLIIALPVLPIPLQFDGTVDPNGLAVPIGPLVLHSLRFPCALAHQAALHLSKNAPITLDIFKAFSTNAP